MTVLQSRFFPKPVTVLYMNNICFCVIYYHSTWMWFIRKHNYKATYGAAALLGVGGSTLLVTALTMLADLIGENVVSCLSQILSLNSGKAGPQDCTKEFLSLPPRIQLSFAVHDCMVM